MDIQEELQIARQAAASGRGNEALVILKNIVEQDPGAVEAWMLLAEVVPKREHALVCLNKVLEVDPGNELARRKLAALQAEPPAEHWGAPAAQEPVRAQEPASPAAPPAPEAQKAAADAAAKKKPAKRSRSPIEIILLVVLGLVFICVCGLLVIPRPTSSNPGDAASQPEETVEDVTAVIYANIRASNAEDMEGYMATIHSRSPSYNQTKEALPTIFGDFDLSYRVSGVEVIRQTSREAVVAFTLTTRKIRGPAFRDNQVNGEMILRREDGVWKIYGQEVDDITYLD